MPGEAQEPPRERKTRRTAWILENLLKTNFLIICTTLECQARFGQEGPPTERQSRRTGVFCVVALKVARGSQRAEEQTRSFFEGSLKSKTKNGHATNQVFYESKRPSRQNLGSCFFEKRRASRAPGDITNPRGGWCARREGRFHARCAVFAKTYGFSKCLAQRVLGSPVKG